MDYYAEDSYLNEEHYAPLTAAQSEALTGTAEAWNDFDPFTEALLDWLEK